MRAALSRFMSKSQPEEPLGLDEFLSQMGQKKESVYDDADALVMYVDLNDDENLAFALDELEKGNFVLLNVRDIQQRNPIKLKTFVAKLKERLVSLDGDLGRITSDIVLATPSKVKIIKRKSN